NSAKGECENSLHRRLERQAGSCLVSRRLPSHRGQPAGPLACPRYQPDAGKSADGALGWISEGPRLSKVVIEIVEQIRTLGPESVGKRSSNRSWETRTAQH